MDDYLGDPFVSAKTIFSLTTTDQKVYTLVPYANASASSKVVYQEIQFKEPSTSFLGKTANSIIYLGNKYDEWKSKYQFIGSMEDMLKTVYHYGGTAIAFGAAPVLTGSIAILTTAYPEQTEQALNYIKDTFQKGLSFIDSDLNQRQLDTLTITAKVTFNTALLKQMTPHAAQNFKNLSSVTGKLLNPTKVKVFDVGRMPKDAIVIDISDTIYSIKPFKSEQPSTLFSEMTSVKAPVVTKSHAPTDLPVNELSIIQKADQQGGGFKFKKSIYIFSQNTLDHTLNITRNISTPKEEAMAIIRNNPQIFQIAVSDFDLGTSYAYPAPSALISPTKPSVSYEMPTDITKSRIFKFESSDPKHGDFTKSSVLGKNSSTEDKHSTMLHGPQVSNGDKELASKVFKELHETLYKDFINKVQEGTLPSMPPHALKDFLQERLKQSFKRYKIKSDVSKYIRDKIELELLTEAGKIRIGEDIHISSVNAIEALTQKHKNLLSGKKDNIKVEDTPEHIKYYRNFRPATTPGPTKGSSNVVEYDSKTLNIISKEESYDHQGNINRIHPKTLNGNDLISEHYPKTKKELEEALKFNKKDK